MRFTGQRDVYETSDEQPFAYGRVSVFYRVRSSRENDAGPLCVKLFHHAPEEKEDGFAKELAALQRLDHPNILRLVDYGLATDANSGPFLILPFCEGGNLRRLLEGRQFMPLSSALPLLEDIATGLDYAHRSGIIHGDIKPENILLSESGQRSYLADFGVAKYFAFREEVKTMTGGEEGGSLLYLSPEQLDRKAYSPRSDIYSFAVVAYEMLCGDLPFDRQLSLYRQIHAKVQGTLIDPQERNPALSDAEGAALRQGLSVDPRQRPESAMELCKLLLHARPKKAVPASQPNPELMAPATIKLEANEEPASSSKSRVAIITAIIAAVGALLTAVVQNFPQILEKLKGK